MAGWLSFCILLGFIVGICVASGLILFALSSEREAAYWSLAQRHFVIDQALRLSLALFVVATGMAFAYVGFLLA